ncbi:MAG: right-handed parallel beta-helix repeat-containing protein [Phycisphaerales bacterium]
MQSVRACVPALVAVVVAPCATCLAATLEVPSQYPTIQAAVDAAVVGDEVVVADGLYTGAGNTLITVAKAITVRSANGAASCVVDGGYLKSGFITSPGVGAATVIEGFTIRRGLDNYQGGGVFVNKGSPTIRDCIITEAYAIAFGGGAISVTGVGAAPIIERCVFANNNAGFYGGGIYVSNSAQPTIRECVFIGNMGFGGGVAIEGTSAHIERCVFAGNDYGGIRIESGTPSTIVNCLFSGNAGAGSGVYAAYNSADFISSCTFTGNVKGAVGGKMAIVNSILEGSVSSAGAPLPDQIDGSTVGITINSSDVVGGWAGTGSNNIDADPLFSILASGTWTAAPTYDAATNTTVYTDATASLVPGALVGRTFNPKTSQARRLWIVANDETTLRVPGNFSTDVRPGTHPNLPVEAGAAYVVIDPRPASGSPVIDAGDNGAVPRDLVVDLDGNPRFVDVPSAPDTGIGRAPLVDLGAFERQADVNPADLNEDRMVDAADLGLLLSAWGGPGGDLDGDGATDGADLGLLLAAWSG